MSWIAQQKAKGKFVGASTGLFLALSWGHWHDRILGYFRLRFNQRFTQLGIIMVILISFSLVFLLLTIFTQVVEREQTNLLQTILCSTIIFSFPI